MVEGSLKNAFPDYPLLFYLYAGAIRSTLLHDQQQWFRLQVLSFQTLTSYRIYQSRNKRYVQNFPIEPQPISLFH